MDTDKIQSATVKVKTNNGFEWLFSIRAETTSDLVSRMETMEKLWLEKNWTPLAQNAPRPSTMPKFEPEYVEGRSCPTCGEKLVYSKKKDGTKFIKCSTNKWNKFKNQAEGCSFIEWPDKKNDIPERQV